MKLSFLALAPNPWEGVWMNRQQILSRIAGRYPVLYSNGLPYWGDEAINKRALFGSFRYSNNVCLDSSPRILFRNRRVCFIDLLMVEIFKHRLISKINSLSDQDAKKICYIFHPKYLNYVDFDDFDLVVYHLYDDFDVLGHGQWKERNREAIVRSDVIIASSSVVAAKLKNIRSGNVYHVPNGVDYDFFAKEDLTSTNRHEFRFEGRCIGYVGSINEKFDFELVDILSDYMKSTNFVMAGRVVNLSASDQGLWDRIISKDNVTYLGQLDIDDVPGLIANLDMVGLFYRTTDEKFGFACDPLKLYEALAVGSQILSSEIEAVKRFEEVVTICRSVDDWEKAISGYSPDGQAGVQVRRKVAEKNTWDKRVVSILNIIEDQLLRAKV